MTEETNVPSTIREAMDEGSRVEWGRPGAHYHRVVEYDGTDERFLLRTEGTLDYLLFFPNTDTCRITWK
jgi:hypothetical protein